WSTCREDVQFARCRDIRSPQHGRGDVRRSGFGEPRGDAVCGSRADRRHVDVDATGHGARRVTEHRFSGSIVGEHAERNGCGERLLRGLGGNRPRFDELSDRLRRTVPDPDGVAGADEAPGHPRAHSAEAQEADGLSLRACGGHSSPRPQVVFRWDCESRWRFSGPSIVKYWRPATMSSSAGNLVMTSHPSAVTTTSSSMRAAPQPSAEGQYVSKAKTIPSSSTSGCSREVRREKIGFSQIERPTPCPYCRANAASSSGKPNSSAVGHSSTMSAVVAPGRTAAMALSMYSRQRL